MSAASRKQVPGRRTEGYTITLAAVIEP